jgi:mitochondrial-processing peptidase subunit alpha
MSSGSARIDVCIICGLSLTRRQVSANCHSQLGRRVDDFSLIFSILAHTSATMPAHTALQVVGELEVMGAVVTAHSSREQMLYCIDVLRDYLDPAMDLLADVVLSPSMTEEEVEEQKVVMQYQMEDILPDMLMKEALQGAAYPGQQLGRPHFCPAAK